MHSKRLFFLLLTLASAFSSRASDTLFNQFHYTSISIPQYQSYRAQLTQTDGAPIYQQPFIAPSIIIPEDLQPFIRAEEIQAVCYEVLETKKTSISNRISTLSHQLVFWKGNHYTNTGRYTGQETWGLLRNENASIWKKIGRGEMLIGGAELLGMGILMLMPKEVTKWPEDWLADAGRNITRAFTTAPVMDEDDWQMNYVGHPLAGALYYNTIRSQNATWFQSFLFSTAQSFIWEYVIEGIAEPPSIQDLIITPVAGTIFGEACHQLTMSMRKNGFSFVEKVVTLVLNPMFVVNNGFGPKHNPEFRKK
jgi:Domain of unknown function (DUF3943)